MANFLLRNSINEIVSVSILSFTIFKMIVGYVCNVSLVVQCSVLSQKQVLSLLFRIMSFVHSVISSFQIHLPNARKITLSATV